MAFSAPLARSRCMRQHHRDESAGDRRGPCAAVCLQDIAVDPDRPLAELGQPGDRTQRSTDQTLYLLRAAPDFAGRRFALRSRGRSARQHAVLGRDPTFSRIAEKRWHAFLDAGAAHDARTADLDQNGSFGVHEKIRSEACGSEFGR